MRAPFLGSRKWENALLEELSLLLQLGELLTWVQLDLKIAMEQ